MWYAKLRKALGPWGMGLSAALMGLFVLSILPRRHPLQVRAGIMPQGHQENVHLAEQNPQNPVLYDEQDVVAFRQVSRRLLDIDEAGLATLGPIDRQGLRLFLDFTEAAPGDRVFTVGTSVRVKISRDVAAAFDQNLRQNLEKAILKAFDRFPEVTGLECPQGLLYVWVLRDTGALRENWGVDPNTEAVTILARYVAIPIATYRVYAPGRSSPFVGLSDTAFIDHACHEFTHALFHASMGSHGQAMPGWFDEGMAVTAAREGPKRVSQEYVNYGRAFRHLQQRMGCELFRSFMRGLSKGLDFDHWLYTTTGYADSSDVIEALERREITRSLIFLAFALTTAVCVWQRKRVKAWTRGEASRP